MTTLRIFAFLLFPAFFVVTYYFKGNTPVVIASVVVLVISYVLIVREAKRRVKEGEGTDY
jgi:hypothetical protein